MRLFSAVILIISLASCRVTKITPTVSGATNYTMEMRNIKENKFEGNIVVEVYDTEKNPINNFTSVLREDGKVVFDVSQTGPRCTFYDNGKHMTIEIKKEGFESVKTEPFEIDEKMIEANFITVTLQRK